MRNRNVLTAMAAILGIALLFLIFNLELPIVRNSFIYAKGAKNIIAHGFNPFPVIADTTLSFGKPIAFSLLAVPFVSILGANAGVKVASFVGTAFFLCVACFFFLRLNKRAGIASRFIPLELVLLFFNPLFFYQFWSAYPDGLFAGLVLLAFILTDVIAVDKDRDPRALTVFLGAVIYAAILTKFYGLILGVACPVYLLMHLRSFIKRSAHVRSTIILSALVFGALGVAVVLARLGKNPTLAFGTGSVQDGGYARFVAGLTNPSGGTLVASIALIVASVVLNFHFSLLFLIKSRRPLAWTLGPACFAGIYVLPLVPYYGTSYNMRFFLPVFPFLIVLLVSAVSRTSRAVRWGILLAYAGVAGFLTLNYNLQSFHKSFPTFNDKMALRDLGHPRPHYLIDNLRLPRHMAASKWIEHINETVEPDGVLYWASMYYGAATHGVPDDLGIRNDINMEYVYTASEIPPTERAVYLVRYRYRGSASEVEGRFAVRSLGSGLFRLTPLRIDISPSLKDHFDRGEPISVEASVSASADADIQRVEFLIDDVSVAVDPDAPYSFIWHDAAMGRHVVTAKVHDSEDNVALSAPVTFFVGIQALERYVARSDDDGEELPNGTMYLTSTDLDLTRDSRGGDQIVGLRFTNIRIRKGAEIEEAYLQFTADEVSGGPTNLIIQAELAGNGAALTDTDTDLSSRARTSSSVSWSPEPWDMVGENSIKQRTPDLSALIEEVTSQLDWKDGNALVFIVSGSGRRVAESYEGGRGRSARLYIAE